MSRLEHSPQDATPQAVTKTSGRSRWVFGGFVALAAVLVAFEHRAHLSGLLSWLPWLILLACPLLHLFMHGGHGSHGGSPRNGDDK